MLSTDGAGPFQDGSVSVDAEGSVAGFVLFDGNAIGEAGLESSFRYTRLLAPVEMDLSKQIRTALAVMNLDGGEKTLSVELRNSAGDLVATGVLAHSEESPVIPPKGHVAIFLDELQWDVSPDLQQFRGVLKVIDPTGTGIVALVLRVDLLKSQLSSVPVVDATP